MKRRTVMKEERDSFPSQIVVRAECLCAQVVGQPNREQLNEIVYEETEDRG